MQIRTKLELLRAMKRNRGASQRGFTLVEVLVVCGILAILFASVVPNLLAARGRAQAAAYVSEAVGIARACQAVVASGIGQDTFTDPATNAVVCDGVASTADVIVSKTWTRELVAEDGIICPDNAQTPIEGAGTLTITIDTATNEMTCAVG